MPRVRAAGLLGAAPSLSREGARALAAMVAVGVAARLTWAFSTYGVAFDIDSYAAVKDALLGAGGPYSLEPVRWPYPAGYFPFVLAAGAGAEVAGPFHGWIQVPPILADAALAIVVCWALRARGAGERTALVAAGAVALGPVFALISGFHGQLDSVAILPAVLGVLLWERGVPRRALWAGALIGLGAAMKAPPAFVALALLPTARSPREGAGLVAAVAAVPLLLTAPWLIIEPRATIDALSYNKGVIGFGGLSAFLQPAITRFWSSLDDPVQPSALVTSVTDVQNVIVVAAVLAVTVLLVRRRAAPLPGAVAIWLTVFAVNPNFAYQYLIWGLPFFLLAGHVRAVIALQVAILPAAALLYGHPDGVDDSGWLYFAAIQAVWLGLVVAAVLAVRRVRPA